jgi:hypothetical protein
MRDIISIPTVFVNLAVYYQIVKLVINLILLNALVASQIQMQSLITILSANFVPSLVSHALLIHLLFALHVLLGIF